MKTSALMITAILFLANVFAQTKTETSEKNRTKFCVESFEGKTVITENGEVLTVPQTIDNGTQLLTDGIVVWRDGSRTILRLGDCIDMNAVIYSERRATDFVGDERALNHIHLLPEVNITEEKGLTIEDKTREFPSSNYESYMVKAYKAIEENDFVITSIKEKLLTKSGRSARSLKRKLNSLEQENLELKIDFDAYVHYGSDNWRLFRKEFNEDMKPVVQDLALLKAKLM
ncbi:hypothetical protein BH11BAC1_BH11BAC1_07160 [soil metagenome]